MPLWQPSLIIFNIPTESGSIIKSCTLKPFQVTYKLHEAGYWTIMFIIVFGMFIIIIIIIIRLSLLSILLLLLL